MSIELDPKSPERVRLRTDMNDFVSIGYERGEACWISDKHMLSKDVCDLALQQIEFIQKWLEKWESVQQIPWPAVK